jgi:hypothetical protein
VQHRRRAAAPIPANANERIALTTTEPRVTSDLPAVLPVTLQEVELVMGILAGIIDDVLRNEENG